MMLSTKKTTKMSMSIEMGGSFILAKEEFGLCQRTE